MSAYILTAAGAVFLTAAAGMILPDGKLNKSVNFVLRLVCIGILVSPLAGIFNFDAESGADADVDYDYIVSVFSQSQSEELEKLVKDELGIECGCEVVIIYEDGTFKQTDVNICTDNVEYEEISALREYLKELGYININVYEEGDRIHQGQ